MPVTFWTRTFDLGMMRQMSCHCAASARQLPYLNENALAYFEGETQRMKIVSNSISVNLRIPGT
jgi:hypothetical protein